MLCLAHKNPDRLRAAGIVVVVVHAAGSSRGLTDHPCADVHHRRALGQVFLRLATGCAWRYPAARPSTPREPQALGSAQGTVARDRAGLGHWVSSPRNRSGARGRPSPASSSRRPSMPTVQQPAGAGAKPPPSPERIFRSRALSQGRRAQLFSRQAVPSRLPHPSVLPRGKTDEQGPRARRSTTRGARRAGPRKACAGTAAVSHRLPAQSRATVSSQPTVRCRL